MSEVNFATKLGIILATAGSAVGLGNIWRFPTTAGANGGAAFILVYLAFTLLLGIPGMMSEFVIGRHGGKNAVNSYAKAGKHRLYGFVGVTGALCGAIILGFYSVVAGWCLYYLCLSVVDGVIADKDTIAATFHTLVHSSMIPVAMGFFFILITHLIIRRGVQGGIEKTSKVFMPVLFVLLLVLVVASCSLPGAMEGIKFLFQPDFSKLTTTVVFEAMGQAFFSLSLGVACLCTYAAYFKRETNLLRSSVQIVAIDCGVAILAGLMIFPASFSVGIQPDAGPSLIFLTLPNVFAMAFPHPIAYVISIAFYFMLCLAALTSTISMHEIGTAALSGEFGISRRKSAWMITIFCCILSLLSSLSMGAWRMGFFGKTLFDNFDALTSNIFMPIGALASTLIVGWKMPQRVVRHQLETSRLSAAGYTTLLFLIRFVCPAGIIVIFLKQIGLL